MVFGDYSMPVLYSVELPIPTHRYHLQALRHLYVLAAEPRLLTPVDVDSNTPCYALIEVTYKVRSEGVWEGVGDNRKLIHQSCAIFIVVASSLGFVFKLWWRWAWFFRQIIEGLCSAHSRITCALMTSWEQNTGQVKGTTKSSNSQVCNNWPRDTVLIFIKRKDFQRHRGVWSHLCF